MSVSDKIINEIKHLVFVCCVLSLAVYVEAYVLNRISSSSFVQMSADLLVARVPLLFNAPQSPSAAVVLITDKDSNDSTAQELTKAWPLPYTAYQTIIARAWCLGAESLYFDIGFQPSQSNTFEERDARNFVSFLDKVAGNAAAEQERAELWANECAGYAEKGVFRKMHVGFVQPRSGLIQKLLAPYTYSAIVSEDFEYRREDVLLSAPSVDEQKQLTLGFAAIEQQCEAKHLSEYDCSRVPTKFRIRDTVFTPREQLYHTKAPEEEPPCIYWGKPLAGESQSDSFSFQTLRSLTRIGRAFINGNAPSDYLSCPPVLTVPYHHFIGEDDAEISNRLNGRVVFVGADIKGVNDNISTSFHAGLPGVYLHALAFQQMHDGNARATVPSIWLMHIVIIFCLIFTWSVLRVSAFAFVETPTGLFCKEKVRAGIAKLNDAPDVKGVRGVFRITCQVLYDLYSVPLFFLMGRFIILLAITLFFVVYVFDLRNPYHDYCVDITLFFLTCFPFTSRYDAIGVAYSFLGKWRKSWEEKWRYEVDSSHKGEGR